jgi:hypothetical protein
MMDRRYQEMLEADVRGDVDAAGRAAREAAAEERRTDAAARNRALLGPETARQRNRSLVGRPRGPLGEAS